MHIGFPDFTFRPEGWTAAKAGAAIRLVPPGAYVNQSRASMVVSPLVPVHAALPDTETLMRQAIAAETAQTGIAVQPDDTWANLTATSGLAGLRWTLQVRFPGSERLQWRCYTMFRDASWLYGVHLVADAPTYAHFWGTYEAFCVSIQAVEPPGAPAP